MRIERFDPVADGTRLAACHALWQAAQRHDDPDGAPLSLAGFTGWWGTGSTGEPRQVWLAADDTGPVGCYLLELPHRENTGLGDTVVVVAPGARRRGLGSELLQMAEEEGRRRGCHTALLHTNTFQAPGFYKKHGWREYGIFPCDPPGCDRIFFTKDLTAS